MNNDTPWPMAIVLVIGMISIVVVCGIAAWMVHG